MSNTNKGESGDGLLLHQAVKLSPLRADEIFTAMSISNGTLYRYFKEPILPYDVKQAAATALGRSIEDIFGPVKNTPTGGGSINGEQSLTSQFTNPEIDMNRIIKMMADSAEASRLFAEGYKMDAEARLLHAQALDRITAAMGMDRPKAQAS